MNRAAETIGIVGAGFQGKAIAFWFARRGFLTLLYDINPAQLEKVEKELNEERIKNRPFTKFLRLARDIEALKECDLIIENTLENLPLKQDVFKTIERMAKKDAILASNSSTFQPSVISKPLKNRQNFINIHYLGVAWGQPKLELVPGKQTSEATLQKSKEILLEAKFKPVETGECQGFIYNRIKLADISNLLRTVELGLLTLEQALKYVIIPRKSLTLASLDFLGLDITEISIRSLNSHFGDRFFVSRILAEKVKNDELGIKTGKGFLDHAQDVSSESFQASDRSRFQSSLQTIYVHELQINNSNLVLQLINGGKQVFLGEKNHDYLSLLKKLDEKLFDKVHANCRMVENDGGMDHFDAILDFPPLQSRQVVIRRVNDLQERFGGAKPYVINLPIYRVEEIARAVKFPQALVGINAQKTYIANTELVRSDSLDRHCREEIREFIGELTGDCIEVADGEVRPLTFHLAAKMFEAVRVLEEGIGTTTDIENLLGDTLFKDIDYFGLDRLLYAANHLRPIFGEPFVPPRLLKRMVKQGRCGVRSGKGFHDYY